MTTTSDRIDSDSRASVPAGYRLVEISREPVELYKILKFEGLAESGGHAKAAVAAGEAAAVAAEPRALIGPTSITS